MSNHLKLVITPRRAGLVHGRHNTVDALIRFQATEQPAEHAQRPRQPLNVAIVIDRSGSMDGRPLREACRAAGVVVERLSAHDRCTVAVYDNMAQTIVPLSPANEKERFHAALRRVQAGGSTDLHAGWTEGASALVPVAGDTAISRVILLSDGHANAGVTEPAQICSDVERLAAAGVTTSTLGLGHGFNEALMTDMARAGRGRAHYGQTADDLMGPLAEELDLLDAIAARRITCRIKPSADVRIEVLNTPRMAADGLYPMPDVAWASEAVIAVRLSLPAHMTVSETLFELLSVRAMFLDADGKETTIDADPLVLPVLDAGEWQDLPADATVARRFDEIEAARLQEEARRAARQGDWTEAERLIDLMRPLAARNPWLSAILNQSRDFILQREVERFSKNARFTADALSSRISGIDEDADISNEDQKRSYIARKMKQGKSRNHN
jgi:Ca-activated chloride channel family protein